MFYPVVLSGGSGLRLWPLSRQNSPKQFIPLVNERNLVQNTCLRFKGLKGFSNPLVVCNETQRFQVAESLREIDVSPGRIVLEPFAKDTAPAVALAAFAIAKDDPGAMMLVLPADHYIDDFGEVLSKLNCLRESPRFTNYLFTFGIRPESPHTGYGYIQCGEELECGAFSVSSFIEKPQEEKAKEYSQSEQYYWNSGMFLFSVEKYLEELKKYCPNIYTSCQQAYASSYPDLDFIRIKDIEVFAQTESKSIDYAVMEQSEDIALLPLSNTKWSDIGSWDALFDIQYKDNQANVVDGDVIEIGAKDCFLKSHDRLLAVAGVSDLVVVETADAVLVADRRHTQDVKKIALSLKERGREEAIQHRKLFSPWGYSNVLVKGSTFAVKKVYINPGMHTSLHLHKLKNKTLTVLSGCAEVLLGGVLQQLEAGESLNIPSNSKHRIGSASKSEPVRLIEIHSGNIVSEEDVIRFADK